MGKTSRVPDLANKSPGHPVKFEFQIDNKYFVSIGKHPMSYLLILKKSFAVYLKLNLTGMMILSGNPDLRRWERSGELGRLMFLPQPPASTKG